ncbi:hypothetical protein [Prosthecobacter sp.]|uniref:hypothetical protein n=1 Tax=Prosthecobacter sp. TaxID=1965333 RepID=UPI00248A8DA9|nr:hypothetical protein [Prosthecobacter sp.]MDI1311242.1 hypothetical protein [Prosthecobacter sp.]
MKTRFLLPSLLLATTAVLAADPPKFVPRPIPGMDTAAPVKAANALLKPVPAQQAFAAQVANPDRARILYIHRRATLPAELTKSLPVTQTEVTVSTTMLNVRQGAVKIISKAEVAQVVKPKS